jgi:hypothetical protein
MIRMMRGERGIGPRVVCDHCGEMIADGREGYVLWQVDAYGIIVTGRPMMVHRGCLRPFERETSSPVLWQRDELLSFPMHLAAGLNPAWSSPGEEDSVARASVLAHA